MSSPIINDGGTIKITEQGVAKRIALLQAGDDRLPVNFLPTEIPPDFVPLELGYRRVKETEAVEIDTSNIRPIDVAYGVVYGSDVHLGANDRIYKTDDNGLNWQIVQNLSGLAGNQASSIRPLGDGEVIMSRRSRLFKSSGWQTNPTTATWTEVLATSGGNANFAQFCLDVYDNVVLTTEYAIPHADSNGVWVSTDYGATFTQRFNLNVTFSERLTADSGSDEETIHWHGAGIDPWANNRLWIVLGDKGTYRRLYYSDNSGETWTSMPYLDSIPTQPSGMTMMTITASRYGMVVSTDSSPDGLYRILRKGNPADMSLEPMATYQRFGHGSGLVGFGQRAFRHTDDSVWVSFQTQVAGQPGLIYASRDGREGDLIYRRVSGSDQKPVIRNIIVTPDNQVLADLDQDYQVGGIFRMLKFPLPFRGTNSLQEVNTGGIMGGVSSWFGVSVGQDSTAGNLSFVAGQRASSLQHSVIIGALASATKPDATVIGYLAESTHLEPVVGGLQSETTGNRATVWGFIAKAGADAVAIGNRAIALGLSVVIGRNAENTAGSGSVAIGHASKVASIGVAIGASTNVTAARGLAIGFQTEATGVRAQSIGAGAKSSFERSIALGADVETSTVNQIAIGATHIEAEDVTSPAAPTAGKGRLFFRDNEGTQEFCVIFANGTTKVIADHTS